MRAATIAVRAAAALLLVAISPGRAHAAAVAEAPTFKIGDTWRWTDGGSRRVVAIDGLYSVTSFSNRDCRNCRAYRDANLTIVKLVDREGNIVVNDSQVGYKMLDFPLAIGKQWESNVPRVNRSTGVVEPYVNTFRVEAYGDVTTKGGTFKAFRITHIQQRAHSTFSTDAGKTWRETLWYSPDVKAFVKREVNTKVDWGPDWELASYALK